jgi:hypothetical protein
MPYIDPAYGLYLYLGICAFLAVGFICFLVCLESDWDYNDWED